MADSGDPMTTTAHTETPVCIPGPLGLRFGTIQVDTVVPEEMSIALSRATIRSLRPIEWFALIVADAVDHGRDD